MLLMTVETSDELFVLEVLPTDDALLLSLVESSLVPEFVHCFKHEHLVVVVFELVYIDEHIVLDYLFPDHYSFEDNEEAKNAYD